MAASNWRSIFVVRNDVKTNGAFKRELPMKSVMTLIAILFYAGTSFGTDISGCFKVSTGLRISLGYESIVECPVPKNWRLFKIYDQEGRSWFNIGHGINIWDGRNRLG
jgi:hypothetical protein